MSDNFGESLQSSPVSSQPSKVEPWKHLFEKAMLESDPKKILPLMHAVEFALCLRWQELSEAHAANEREAMKAAAADLWALQTHKLGWPGVSQSFSRK